jgi:catechol 2,3-dioxygenase-like lactoylglutathione lyase family enzyme
MHFIFDDCRHRSVRVPRFTRPHHLALSVSDMERSAAWYRTVLGFRLVRRFDTGIPRILQMHPDSGFYVSLYNHPDRAGERFDPRRTGLDHLAFAVPDASSLDAWKAHLDTNGVESSPVRDLRHALFVSLEDPDGVQLELWHTVTPLQAAEHWG